MAMSQPVVSETFRDLAMDTASIVDALTEDALMLLLGLSLSTAGADLTDAQQGKRDAIKQAQTFLRSDFKSRFRKLVSTLSEDLDQAHKHLLEAIEGLLKDLPAHSSDREAVEKLGGDDRVTYLTEMAKHTDIALMPAAKTFQDVLWSKVDEAEKAASKESGGIDAQALSQIDAIARQINFIAVNAAVEAARVGSAGKGFAIIAAEIKSLSQESQKAVERIRAALN